MKKHQCIACDNIVMMTYIGDKIHCPVEATLMRGTIETTEDEETFKHKIAVIICNECLTSNNLTTLTFHGSANYNI